MHRGVCVLCSYPNFGLPLHSTVLKRDYEPWKANIVIYFDLCIYVRSCAMQMYGSAIAQPPPPMSM